jgi:hypothetical protein
LTRQYTPTKSVAMLVDVNEMELSYQLQRGHTLTWLDTDRENNSDQNFRRELV